MVHPVKNHDRSKRAGSEAVDVFHREFAVFGNPARFHVELIGGLVEQQFCVAHMTGSARADGEPMLSPRG